MHKLVRFFPIEQAWRNVSPAWLSLSLSHSLPPSSLGRCIHACMPIIGCELPNTLVSCNIPLGEFPQSDVKCDLSGQS